MSDRKNPAMPRMTSAFGDPDAERKQIQIVVDDDHLSWTQLQGSKPGRDTKAASIHEVLGLKEDHLLLSQRARGIEGLHFPLLKPHPSPERQFIHHQKTDIVARLFVFRTRISQTDNQPQRSPTPAHPGRSSRGYSFSSFPFSSFPSFLLTTSGWGGAASTGTASSSFSGATTRATTISGPSKIFTPSVAFRSAT